MSFPKELLERKRHLLAESARVRAEIGRELDHLEASLHWVDTGVRLGQTLRRSTPILAGLGGFLMLLRPLWNLWRKPKPAANRNGHSTQNGAPENHTLFSKLLGSGVKAAQLLAPIPLRLLLKRL